MGVSGACRCCELTNLKISDVEDRGAYLIVPTTTIRSGTDNNYKLLIIPLVE
jgi:acetoacetate decarboxylase